MLSLRCLLSCALAVIGGIYAVNAAPYAPVVSPNGGYYKGTIYAGLRSPGATNPDGSAIVIHYTTDGTTPTSSSPTYTFGVLIKVTSSMTLQAIATDDTGTSSITSAAFNIDSVDPTTPALPTISPNGGNYTSGAVPVTLASSSGAKIYYTTDGTVPSASSTLYSGTAIQLSASANLRAIAIKSSLGSGIATATFTFGYAQACVAPTMTSSATLPFNGSTQITISSSTPNATIRYTNDGMTAPDSTATQLLGTKYLGATTTLKAYASFPGMADSPVTTTTFTAAKTTTQQINVNVAPYNVNSGATDNRAALQQAIQDAAQYPSARVYFGTPGTYQFASEMDPLSVNNLTIDGQGSTLVFANAAAAFQSTSCNNILIENMIIDSAASLDTPGTVTAKDSTGYDCLLDPGFPASNVPDKNGLLTKTLQYDPVQRSTEPFGLDLTLKTGWSVNILSPNKVHIGNTSSKITQGDYYNLRPYIYGPVALTFYLCDGVNVSNVTFFASAGMGITGQNCCDISLANVDLMAKPGSGRLSSACADGTHWTSDQGLISYANCHIQDQGDDGVNVHGVYDIISAHDPNGAWVEIPSPKHPIVHGELIEFRKGNGLLTAASGPSIVDQASDNGTTCHITFLTATPAPGSNLSDNVDLIDSLTWLPHLSINRCSFYGNRAHGTLVKTRNAIVQNSRYENITAGPIHVETTSDTYYESTGTNNVQIVNNSIEHCGYGAAGDGGCIDVLAEDDTGADGLAGVHRNTVIADNTIRDADDAAIVVSAADGVDVLNNTIANCSITGTYPHGGGDAIYVYNANNVRINNNTEISVNTGSSMGNYLRYQYNEYLPYRSPLQSGYLNVQPFIIGFSQTSQHHAQFSYSWNVQSAIPSGNTAYAALYNSAGSSVLTIPTDSLGTPSGWQNGARKQSASPLPVDLTSVADGTYTLRLSIGSGGTLQQLLGADDTFHHIIAGTVTISGNGATIAFASKQLDVKPVLSTFKQTGPRQFTIGYTWNVFDTIPAGETTYAEIRDASGNLLQTLPTGTTPDPSTWTLNGQTVSTVSTVTLGSEADATNDTINIALQTSGGVVLPLSGQSDSRGRIVAGALTIGDGPFIPIRYDSGSTNNVTLSSNTGFAP